MIRTGLLALVLWSFAATLASAQTDAARAAMDRLAEAEALLAAAETRADRVAALTETVTAYEDGLNALRDGLRRIAIRRQALTLELDARADDIARLLDALQRIERSASPEALLHPTGPLGAARAGMLAAEMAPALQQQVTRIEAMLADIAALEAAQQEATRVLRRSLDGARTARLALTTAISDRTDLPQRYRDDPARMAELVAASETLTQFVEGLATLDAPILGQAPDARDLQGSLPLPVEGRLLRRFGEPDAAGIVRPGWIIAARPGAVVTTPVAATIRFHGPLLDYGTVVLLEPAPDVLFVFAGLGAAFGEVGQILPAGSPVGIIGGQPPTPDAILTDPTGTTTGNRSETLYLEVRDGPRPIDPAEWFADTTREH